MTLTKPEMNCKRPDKHPEWQAAPAPVPYPQALATMEARAAAITAGTAAELVWLVEHPPLYTGGSSASSGDLLEARFPVFETGRGGQYTYHGPGQRVVYVMLDLNQRGRDVRQHVWNLEEWVIRALVRFDVTAVRREGRVGLWVARNDGSDLDDKIAAIGVRVKKWVTSHGIATNIATDLSHYSGIIPCGIREHGVTSLQALGRHVTMVEFDAALQAEWNGIFHY